MKFLLQHLLYILILYNLFSKIYLSLYLEPADHGIQYFRCITIFFSVLYKGKQLKDNEKLLDFFLIFTIIDSMATNPGRK